VLSRPFWLSLQTGRTSALAIKVPNDEKFASEIFYNGTSTRFVAAQQGSPTQSGWADQTGTASRVSFPFPWGTAMGRHWCRMQTPNK
jgi:hypothetical protein